MILEPRKRFVLIAMAFAFASSGWIAPARAQDLHAVVAKLDASAAKFKSAQADVVWDAVQTQPIPDSDKQAGTILFARSGSDVKVALHLTSHNGKPFKKTMVYANGQGKLNDGSATQTFAAGNNKSTLDAFLTLGFGGSGADLEKNWTVTDQGTEAVNGVQAAKLQLIPKDPAVAKATPKVILWVDMDKGVGVQQQRFDTSGNYSMITYSNIKMGVSAPASAFQLK